MKHEEILSCYISKEKFQLSHYSDCEFSEQELEHLNPLDGNDCLFLWYNDTFNWGESYAVPFIAIGDLPIRDQLEKFIAEHGLDEKLQDFRNSKYVKGDDVYKYFAYNTEKIQPLMQALYSRHPIEWFEYLIIGDNI